MTLVHFVGLTKCPAGMVLPYNFFDTVSRAILDRWQGFPVAPHPLNLTPSPRLATASPGSIWRGIWGGCRKKKTPAGSRRGSVRYFAVLRTTLPSGRVTPAHSLVPLPPLPSVLFGWRVLSLLHCPWKGLSNEFVRDSTRSLPNPSILLAFAAFPLKVHFKNTPFRSRIKPRQILTAGGKSR